MGRILMINDANFSQNAIGKVYPSDAIIKSKLRNDGTSYINTDIVLANTDVLTVRGYLSSDNKPNVNNSAFLFGWRTMDGGNNTYGNVQALAVNNAGSTIHGRFLAGGHGAAVNNFNVDEEHTFVLDFVNNVAYLDGNIYNSSPEVDFSHALGMLPLLLFCVNLQGTTAGFCKSSEYISDCTITRNGEKILDLVPCVYNGVAGMWDRVSDTFFGAAAGGVFIAE